MKFSFRQVIDSLLESDFILIVIQGPKITTQVEKGPEENEN